MAAATRLAPLPTHELYLDEPKQLPKLRSNVGQYVDPSCVGWMKPTPADTPLEEMRRRFEEHGYVYVKGVIPREAVMDMREQ